MWSDTTRQTMSPLVGRVPWLRDMKLRRGIGVAAALTAGLILASCAPAGVSAPTATAAAPIPTASLPPPETTSIRLTAGPCDSAIFGAERYLRDECFTDVQFSDMGTSAAIAAGSAHIGNAFPQAFFNTVIRGSAAPVATIARGAGLRRTPRPPRCRTAARAPRGPDRSCGPSRTPRRGLPARAPG